MLKIAGDELTFSGGIMKLVRSMSVAIVLSGIGCSEATVSTGPINALPRTLSVAENKVIAASNDFAFGLFQSGNTDQHKANVFISPLSASMALGMTANGANGSTYDEMIAALKLTGATRADVGEGYKNLISLLTGLDPKTNFTIANSIWYEQTFPFNTSFLEDSKKYFDAQVTGLDFTNPSSVGTINAWVSAKTNNKIPTILETIREEERMFLINAIYFKGTWQKQFDKSKTMDATFHNADGTMSTVPMMAREAGVKASANSEYVAVDLPYGNSAFTMTVILPHVDIDAFAESFDQTKWTDLVNALHDSEMPV